MSKLRLWLVKLLLPKGWNAWRIRPDQICTTTCRTNKCAKRKNGYWQPLRSKVAE